MSTPKEPLYSTEALAAMTPEQRSKAKVFELKLESGALSPEERATMYEAACLQGLVRTATQLNFLEKARLTFCIKQLISGNAIAGLIHRFMDGVEKQKKEKLDSDDFAEFLLEEACRADDRATRASKEINSILANKDLSSETEKKEKL